MSGTSDYQVFGLTIRSEIPLPELLAVERGDDPHVTITKGGVAPRLPAHGLQSIEGGLLLNIPGIARYEVRGGSQILVDAAADAPDRNVRLYLLGSALGALLHQRGLLPLHANAVEVGNEAVAFMGASGLGKSTLAAWFHDSGYRVIADDVCVVGPDSSGRPTARPGLPRLRLWKEALEASGRDSANYERAWAGSEEWDKFDVPLEHPSVVEEDRLLRAVYVLKRSDEFDIQPVTGSRAAQALIENTYRGRAVQVAGDMRLHWETCMLVAERVPLFEFRRPWGLSRLGDDMAALLLHLSGVDTKRAPGSV
jgi:hypothetical protein